MNQWRTLTEALSRTMRAHAPGWTDHGSADPGITLLEMLAFLAESLHAQRGVVANGSLAASRIMEALSAYDELDAMAVRVNGTLWRRVDALAEAGPDDPVYAFDQATGALTFGDGVRGRKPETGNGISVRYNGGAGMETWMTTHEHWCGPKRPRFFSGRLLTADDFTEEQSYHREKHRRHVLALHGSGVVDGLRVTVGADGATLTIEPGLAIDPSGREVCIDQAIEIAIPAGTPSPAAVTLHYAERLVDPLPTSTAQEPSRIEEGTRVEIATSGNDGATTIARIVGDGDGWQVDASFTPARSRP